MPHKTLKKSTMYLYYFVPFYQLSLNFWPKRIIVLIQQLGRILLICKRCFETCKKALQPQHHHTELCTWRTCHCRSWSPHWVPWQLSETVRVAISEHRQGLGAEVKQCRGGWVPVVLQKCCTSGSHQVFKASLNKYNPTLILTCFSWIFSC